MKALILTLPFIIYCSNANAGIPQCQGVNLEELKKTLTDIKASSPVPQLAASKFDQLPPKSKLCVRRLANAKEPLEKAEKEVADAYMKMMEKK